MEDLVQALREAETAEDNSETQAEREYALERAYTHLSNVVFRYLGFVPEDAFSAAQRLLKKRGYRAAS